MKSFFRTALYITIINVLFINFTSCKDDKDEPEPTTGPAIQLKGIYSGTLLQANNNLTENVSLKVSVITGNQIKLDFIGEGLPDSQKDVFLVVNEEDNNIIKESANSLNLFVTISYNRNEQKLEYRLYDRPADQNRKRIFLFRGDKQELE